MKLFFVYTSVHYKITNNFFMKNNIKGLQKKAKVYSNIENPLGSKLLCQKHKIVL